MTYENVLQYLTLDSDNNFRDIYVQNKIYVDKTDYVEKLLKDILITRSLKSSIVFLSRPRRFGKTLLKNTLRLIFKNNLEYFDKSSICKFLNEHANLWKNIILLEFEFSRFSLLTPSEFEKSLRKNVWGYASEHGVQVQIKPSDNATLGGLIKKTVESIAKKKENRGKKIVLLVDEYDKPFYDAEWSNRNKTLGVMGRFYSGVKEASGSIAFGFITGCTKLMKAELFSGTNMIEDISLNGDYDKIVGFTEHDIETYYRTAMVMVGKNYNPPITMEDVMKKVKEWYEGYRFTYTISEIYNPVSVLGYLRGLRLNDPIPRPFWATTALGSSLLSEMLRSYPSAVLSMFEENVRATAYDLSTKLNPDLLMTDKGAEQVKIILYHAGYLTVQDVEETYPNSSKEHRYTFLLGFTNTECKTEIMRIVIEELKKRPNHVARDILIEKLEGEKFEDFISLIKRNLESPLELEIRYHLLFVAMLEGDQVSKFIHKIQVNPKQGKNKWMDYVLDTTKNMNFLFEFKIASNSEDALEECEDKYWNDYYKTLKEKKKVACFGIKFDNKSVDVITEWGVVIHDENGVAGLPIGNDKGTKSYKEWLETKMKKKDRRG